MCAHVIGVVRGATSLDALTYEAREPADREVPWRIEQACEPRPLAHRARPELWSAWRALEAVSRWDEATLEQVLVILRETVPCADAPGDLPALGSEVHAPPEPRATAAHPRAFRGTKHRPPRPQHREAIDLRPYLLARRHVDQVLELLGQPRGIDPYVAWNHAVDASASFEPAFVMFLLPLFRTCAWSDVGAFAALARALELQARPLLRAALVGVYLAAGDPARALGWWSHVLAHPVEQQCEVARLVGASAVAKLPPIDPAVGAVISSLDPVQQWSCYRALAGGAAPAYVLSGLRLGAISYAKIEELPPGRADVTAVVEATVARLGEAMGEDSGAAFWLLHLWRLCGHQPELIELLASADFASLQPKAAFWLLRVAASPRWMPATAEREWRALAPQLTILAGAAARLPPGYQRKLVEDLADVYWWAADREHDIGDALSKCLEICQRVARPPFGTRAVLGPVLPYVALIHDDDWRDRHAMRDAPDASWLALEEACSRDNQARVLWHGLGPLAHRVPGLLVSAFSTTTGALLQTADLLAAISFEAAERLIAAYQATPLADPALEEAPIERLCELVEPIARAGGPNPVRRALRRHLSGEATLSEAQLRGHRERIVADLGILRLAAIRQAVERTLAARVGIEKIETPAARHAVAMLNHVDVHRRQLRRLLAASLAGDRGWKLRHPRSQEWFTKHPGLPRDAWLAGIETRAELAGIGEVRVAVETDPLEALKLGTYVGSCLGRGGRLEYSAAAVVLDVNKQVIYARDARGAVVGRQLVAISEANELVCFAVHGAAKAELLEPLFREHDRAFASKLGLPIFGGGAGTDAGASYEIAWILSHEWWDDGAWLGVVAGSEDDR